MSLQVGVCNGLRSPEDAWWYRKYAPKDKELAKAEATARKAKRGLWADPNPIPPWVWRQKQREKEKPVRSDVDTGHWLNTTMVYL